MPPLRACCACSLASYFTCSVSLRTAYVYDAQNYSLGSKLKGSHCKSKSFATKQITLVIITFFCWIGISCCFLHSFTQTQFFKLCIGIEHLSEVSHCGHCLNSLFINVSGLSPAIRQIPDRWHWLLVHCNVLGFR